MTPLLFAALLSRAQPLHPTPDPAQSSATSSDAHPTTPVQTPSTADPAKRTTVVRQSGYLDVGWFDAQGDGVAYSRDSGHTVLGQQYDYAPWIFYGDPWSNPINSQGDSADLGSGDNNIDRFDPIASGGRPSFIVNRLHHSMYYEHDHRIGVRAQINVEPRTGRHGRLGDVVALDTAHLVWRPFKRSDLKLYVGKFEPSFGREYRYRHAPSRFGITPSLIGRYLMGPQTGLRVRGSLHRWFAYSLALTNGTPTDERFGHFSDELDSNGVPTTTARIGALVRRPVRFEAGLSGMIGAQDGQSDRTLTSWQAGFDARLDIDMIAVEVEGLITERPGDLAGSDALNAIGGLVSVELRPVMGLGLLARLDFRDAELRAENNLYVTDTMRITAGVRVEATQDLTLKAEYLRVLEVRPLGDRSSADDIANDVLTTSVVYKYSTRRNTP